MTTNPGKRTPSKSDTKAKVYCQQSITGAEIVILERYMRGISRTMIENPPSNQNLNLMLNNCIQHLSTHGFASMAHLDVNKPDEGSLKLLTLREKVLELMEELGTFREAMGSSFVTA